MRYQTVSDLRIDGSAGDFAFRFKDDKPVGMYFICPCGCGEESYLNLDSTQSEFSCWVLFGGLNRPTIIPSIYNTKMPCKWHGWLTDGKWIDA